MNKQVISFLSLFSLVLVLSIYYVVIPASANTVKPVDEHISSSEDLSISDTSNLFFTVLQENRKARHDEVKNAQIEILASSTYSNEEKLEAREKLTYEELIEKTEVGLEKSLDELSFNDCFVEKLDSNYYVTVFDNTLTSENDLIKVVQIADCFKEYFNENQHDDLSSYRPIVNFVSF